MSEFNRSSCAQQLAAHLRIAGRHEGRHLLRAHIPDTDTVYLTQGATLDLFLLSAMNPFSIKLWSLSGIGPDVNVSAVYFDNARNYTWNSCR